MARKKPQCEWSNCNRVDEVLPKPGQIKAPKQPETDIEQHRANSLSLSKRNVMCFLRLSPAFFFAFSFFRHVETFGMKRACVEWKGENVKQDDLWDWSSPFHAEFSYSLWLEWPLTMFQSDLSSLFIWIWYSMTSPPSNGPRVSYFLSSCMYVCVFWSDRTRVTFSPGFNRICLQQERGRGERTQLVGSVSQVTHKRRTYIIQFFMCAVTRKCSFIESTVSWLHIHLTLLWLLHKEQ